MLKTCQVTQACNFKEEAYTEYMTGCEDTTTKLTMEEWVIERKSMSYPFWDWNIGYDLGTLLLKFIL